MFIRYSGVDNNMNAEFADSALDLSKPRVEIAKVQFARMSLGMDGALKNIF